MIRFSTFRIVVSALRLLPRAIPLCLTAAILAVTAQHVVEGVVGAYFANSGSVGGYFGQQVVAIATSWWASTVVQAELSEKMLVRGEVGGSVQWNPALDWRPLTKQAMAITPKALLVGVAIGVGFAFFVIPGLILLTAVYVFAPVYVVEQRHVKTASRSIELIRHHAVAVAMLGITTSMLATAGWVLINEAVTIRLGEGLASSSLIVICGSFVIAPLHALVHLTTYAETRAFEVGVEEMEAHTKHDPDQPRYSEEFTHKQWVKVVGGTFGCVLATIGMWVFAFTVWNPEDLGIALAIGGLMTLFGIAVGGAAIAHRLILRDDLLIFGGRHEGGCAVPRKAIERISTRTQGGPLLSTQYSDPPLVVVHTRDGKELRISALFRPNGVELAQRIRAWR